MKGKLASIVLSIQRDGGSLGLYLSPQGKRHSGPAFCMVRHGHTSIALGQGGELLFARVDDAQEIGGIFGKVATAHAKLDSGELDALFSEISKLVQTAMDSPDKKITIRVKKPLLYPGKSKVTCQSEDLACV